MGRTAIFVLWLASAWIVGCGSEPAADPKTEPATASGTEQAAGTGFRPLQLLSKDDVQKGWIELFDGQTMFGWKPNNDVNWSIQDGVIRANEGEPGLLMTTAPFADFELRFEARLEKDGNSGVFLRSLFNPRDPAADCYELNICDSHPAFRTGSLVGRAQAAEATTGEGTWRSYYVRAEGPHIVVQIDGKQVLDFNDSSQHIRKSGFIGLQKNKGLAEYRSVFLRPLNLQSLFNGQDLSGWRVVPGSKGEFQAVDGTIHVTGGRGFLETDGTWSDFVLQAQAKTNAPGLNGGIFFRAEPGTEAAPSNGYEYQIHNAFKDGDRTQPVDAGTGAIFRRTSARYVVADDGQWLTATLVAAGPHFSCWVDGVQVTDWEDDRPNNLNPREGKRLEAGHISLQGHDPTTNIDFRDLGIGDLPK